MSIQAVAWVLDHSEATGPQRLVLIALANHADKDTMSCWPSVTTIAHEARLHRTTVMRAIGELEASDQLAVERTPGGGRGKVSRYRLLTEPPEETVAESDRSPEPPAPETVAQTVALTRETVALEPLNGRSRATRTIEPLEPKNPLPAAPARAGWSAKAHELTCRWWEARVAEDGSAPGQPFPAAAKVVHELLRKGWHPDLIARGLEEVPTVSGAAFDLWRRRQTNGGASREQRSHDVLRERVEARRGR